MVYLIPLQVTDAVHEKGSFVYSQIWALGRAAGISVLEQEGLEYIGASDIPITGKPNPRALTTASMVSGLHYGHYGLISCELIFLIMQGLRISCSCMLRQL